MGKLKGILMLFMSFLIFGAVGISLGAPLAVGGTIGIVSALIPKGTSLAFDLSTEVWHDFIVENLYKNNAFLKNSVDVTGFVIDNRIVHIPNAGKASRVVKNRKNLPAKIHRRNDTDVLYALDEFTTDPILITRAEEIETSYDKMASVLGNDVAALSQNFAENMLYNWSFALDPSFYIKTTGDAVPSHLKGTTGNRKAFTIEMFEEAQAMFDEQGIPEEDRLALLDARMYQQLIRSMSTNDVKDFSKAMDPTKGTVGNLFGFDVAKRSSVLRANQGITQIYSPEDLYEDLDEEIEAKTLATDVACALFWQKGQVERAEGEIETFDDQGNPTYYGDLFSFLMRGGGRKRRADNKGVLGVVQTIA